MVASLVLRESGIKALQEFVRAVQLTPADISARFNLAQAMANTNQPDYAMQQLQGIVRNQPQNADAWQLIAQIQNNTGRKSESIQTYQRVKEMYSKLGQSQKAAEILREIMKVDPGYIQAYRELADIAKARGDRKTAAVVTVDLGRHYLEQGQTKDAISAANEALMLMPGMLQAQNLKDDAGGSQPAHGSTRAGALPAMSDSSGLSVNPRAA